MANIYDINGNILSTEEIIEPSQYDIPSIYLTGTLPTAKTDGELAQTFKYVSATQTIECFGTLKVQGNTSTQFPKKNFTLKLYQDSGHTKKNKVNFKGWGKQSKYVLKANWIDITHARNVVGARLWADIVKCRDYWASLPNELKTSPNQGAVDGFPVKVYSNDVYWGRYTLNIPKDKWMTNMDDDLDTHCILCSENYVSGCFRAPASINGSDWTDELHDSVPSSIVTRWNQVIDFVMNSTDSDFVANIENYFDIESIIDYYIYAYVSTGLDSLGKNQLFFTYDGQKWIASMYDMDAVFGLYWDGTRFVSASYRMQEDYETGKHNTSNLLYDRLKNLFADKIKSRYEDLRVNVLSASHIIERFKEFTSIASQSLIQADYASTTGNGDFTNIPSKTTNTIVQIREYVLDRLAYVDSMIL